MTDTAVDLPLCTSIQDIQDTTGRDAHLQELKAYVIKGWLHKKMIWQKTLKNNSPSGMSRPS